MPNSHSLDLTLKSTIGRGGIADAALARARRAVRPALARLRREFADGSLPLLGLPAETRDLKPVREAVARMLSGARDIVFLGTGGSSLGGQMLCQLADYNVPGLGRLGDAPRLHFMDNLDEQTFQGFLARLPLRSARFVAISKSGSTGETLLQAIGVIDALRASGVKGKLGRFILGLSEPRREGKANNLRDLLVAEGAAFLDHHTGVGGRFSVLTNVGLLAAAFAGIDIRAIRRGAASAVAAVIAGDASPAAEGAALNLAAMREGRNIAVLMGYGDRFERLTRWWVQLWAESLGKSGMGSQPVAALGPVDQHSQQQLYLAGPRDKLFTVLTVAPRRAAPKVSPVRARQAGEPGFAGRSIDQFVAAQSRAMIDTFAANGCPVRHIHLARLDAAVLGDLAMHFMLETILTGYAMGIDPFDQPAVEEAKLLAKRYLGEAG